MPPWCLASEQKNFRFCSSQSGQQVETACRCAAVGVPHPEASPRWADGDAQLQVAPHTHTPGLAGIQFRLVSTHQSSSFYVLVTALRDTSRLSSHKPSITALFVSARPPPPEDLTAQGREEAQGVSQAKQQGPKAGWTLGGQGQRPIRAQKDPLGGKEGDK